MLKSSMLQRQLKMTGEQINAEHIAEQDLKRNIAWLKNLDEISSTRVRVSMGYKELGKIKKRIKLLTELQKFTKRELQQAYIEEARIAWRERLNEMRIRTQGLFRHAPIFMAEAPPAEIGSFVEDEQ